MGVDFENLGLVEIRPGVWKSRADIEQERQDLVDFRSTLEEIVVPEVVGRTVQLSYGGDEFAFEVSQILVGPRGLYVEGLSGRHGEIKTFAAERIGYLIDDEGRRHDRVVKWLMRSGEAGAGLGSALGWRMPRELSDG